MTMTTNTDLFERIKKVTDEFDDKPIDEENYRLIDGLYYFYDENHFGNIWVTPEMIEKHNLQAIVEPIEDGDNYTDWDWEASAYTHSIFVTNCSGVSKGNTRKDWHQQDSDTPFGEVWSDEFRAWWNEFPLALLDEPEEQVMVWGLADG